MSSSSPDPDVTAAVAALAGCHRPYLIGVRHHSPVLAAAVPSLLDAYRPEVVLVELPDELGEWLGWLGHPETVTPVALAAAGDGDAPLAFYPFADFSPELAAVRWAHRAGVPVVAADLPLAHRAWTRAEHGGDGGDGSPTLGRAVGTMLTGRAGDDLWDRWVEAAAPGSAPERVRRAALAVGWALRHETEQRSGVDPLDQTREGWMRHRIAAQDRQRVAAVVGAFHAPALLPPAGAPPPAPAPAGRPVVTSLVPYTFALLDARSGYPAGIRDPQWQQAVHACGARPSELEQLAGAFAVRVTSALRAAGHPAGPAEAREAARLAVDLARIRGLPAPGRGELVEALQSTLAHGSPAGRGRAVAEAMRTVLIGDQRGRLAPGAPVCGLAPSVAGLLAELRLPGAGEDARSVHLDPLRSRLDRRREITLQRLVAATVPYGEAEPVAGIGGTDALSTAWWLEWTPATDAGLVVAGRFGVTLAQAAEGSLRARRRTEQAAGGPTAAQALAGLATAAGCGLAGLVEQRLADVADAVCRGGTLAELVAGIELAERLRLGHVPGLPEAPPRLAAVAEELHAAAVRAVDGLLGSDQVDHARALLALVDRKSVV